MYLPRSFEETDLATMHDFVRAHPLATLVTALPGYRPSQKTAEQRR